MNLEPIPIQLDRDRLQFVHQREHRLDHLPNRFLQAIMAIKDQWGGGRFGRQALLYPGGGLKIC
jgi:hypothetical protein